MELTERGRRTEEDPQEQRRTGAAAWPNFRLTSHGRQQHLRDSRDDALPSTGLVPLCNRGVMPGHCRVPPSARLHIFGVHLHQALPVLRQHLIHFGDKQSPWQEDSTKNYTWYFPKSITWGLFSPGPGKSRQSHYPPTVRTDAKGLPKGNSASQQPPPKGPRQLIQAPSFHSKMLLPQCLLEGRKGASNARR